MNQFSRGQLLKVRHLQPYFPVGSMGGAASVRTDENDVVIFVQVSVVYPTDFSEVLTRHGFLEIATGDLFSFSADAP